MPAEDTIVAIATPPGRGGIGVVRLSGSRALEIAAGLLKLPHSRLETQRATVCDFVEPESQRVLDQVVVTCFHAPHSYTAEDVVEISSHGAPVILNYLVELCLERGARAAEPGEFTLRAFLNGRIDLTQAEAVRDLIESRTLYQARVAAEQLEGSVSARLKPHKKVLVELIARLEAGIDFAEDDVSVAGWDEILQSIEKIRADLGIFVQSYTYGRIVREGLSLAIAGRPNVGKSSLFNCLLNEDRAIVTATPGTTRDLVSESSSVGGIPLRFVDTAGIRDGLDEAEKIGVQKSMQAVADSDLRLLVIDSSQPWSDEDARLLDKLRPLGALLVALNKSDLPRRIPEGITESVFSVGKAAVPPSEDRAPSSESPVPIPVSRIPAVPTCALTGAGIHELREAILAAAVPARDLGGESGLITNLRHQQLIQESLGALAKAREAARAHVHHEMLLLDLYDALRPLDQITGATGVEDVLDVIFSTFCVGK
jgi:tRNA modification GTPase